MSDIHITHELLQTVARGQLPTRFLLETAWRHLLKLCPTCNQEYRAWTQNRSVTADYHLSLQILPAVAARYAKDMKRARRTAKHEARALMDLPQKARLSKIRRSRRRFRGILLAQLLLEESKQRMTTDLEAAGNLAETAEAVLLQTPLHPDLPALRAIAAVYRANVSRLRGFPEKAGATFALARTIIRVEGVTDLLVYAEADSCEAVLALELRRFQEAEELLNRSVAFYLVAGAREKAAHPLTTLSRLRHSQGNPMEAIEMGRAALELMNPQNDPRLFLFANLNLALFLFEAGLHSQAAEALAGARAPSRRFPDPYTQLRILWLEGRLAEAAGNWEEAESTLLGVRKDLVLMNQGYDAAKVSLDLGLLYMRQHRTNELMQVADDLRRLFTAEEVQREAQAAFLVFQEAAKKARVSQDVIRNLETILIQPQA